MATKTSRTVGGDCCGQRAPAPKLLVLRFDVDTQRCIREGVPNLLDLADDVGARFTFFVNMGRAVDRVATLAAMFRGRGRTRSSVHRSTRLSARSKLGLRHYLVAALVNPRVGAGSPEVIRRILRDGHEVGLHGGRNHGTWQAAAHKWPEGRIAREVAAGCRSLRRTAGRWAGEVRGFASPGWQGPPGLWPVLVASGFRYVADTRGRCRAPDLAPASGALLRVPTHLVGEPGGVAYLEHHQAIGSTDSDVLADFEAALGERRRSLVLYDHPCYAGIRKLPLLRRMIEAGRRAGYRTATLSELAAAHRAAERP